MKPTKHPLTNALPPSQNSLGYLSKIINITLWLLFLVNFILIVVNYNNAEKIDIGYFGINGFTLLIWTVVTFFGAIISSFSKKYLTGFRYAERFSILTLGFILSVMVFVASDHVLPFILSWFVMGFFISSLIGIDKEWAEAKQAAKFAQKYFTASSLLLAIGVLALAYSSNNYRISGILAALQNISFPVLLIAALCIFVAGIIQSAIYPFHRWLLSAMTAPTPASALMHAGFVNGAGILLTIFATLFYATGTLNLLFILGGITAIIAQFTKLLQVGVKQKLACSTIAQMGFMIMQCGLGFFNAAVVHLILHGFYKAYLFLSSGESVEASAPKDSLSLRIKPLQLVAVIVAGVLGAWLFVVLTGKGFELNSSIFLTLIVAITVGQATYNIVKESALSSVQKIFLPAILFFVGIGCYALMYNAVTKIMSDMPMVHIASPLSFIQILFGVIFLIGFFIMKLGIYRKVSWVYVKLLNDSQPNKKTVLTYNNN